MSNIGVASASVLDKLELMIMINHLITASGIGVIISGFLLVVLPPSPSYTVVCSDGFVVQDVELFKYDRYYLHYLIDGEWGKYQLDNGITCTSDSK